MERNSLKGITKPKNIKNDSMIKVRIEMLFLSKSWKHLSNER